MSDQVDHEVKRSFRFEPVTVETANADGTVDASTAGRSQGRPRMARGTSGRFRNGDRGIIISSRDNDTPILFGQNPWVTE